MFETIAQGQSTSLATLKTNQLYKQVDTLVKSGRVIPESMQGAVLAIESADVNTRRGVQDKMKGLAASLKAIGTELKTKYKTPALEAAAYAAVHAQDWKSFVNHKQTGLTNPGANRVVVNPRSMGDMVSGRWRAAMEAYDETENRNAVTCNISYQLGAASQTVFGETIWPTIVMDPTKAEFEIVADLMMVYDRAEHNIDGSALDFQKKNLLRAIADPNILKKDQNKAIPVVRSQNAASFVDPALIAPFETTNGEEKFDTAPLATGKKLNLIALSQTDSVITAGGANQTDTLDPFGVVKNLYVRVTIGGATDVLRIKTASLPYSNFTSSVQDNYRRMTLAMQSTSVLINKDTKQANGAALVALAPVVLNDWRIRLEINATGYINIETGEAMVDARVLGIHSMQNNNDVEISQTAAPQVDVVTGLIGSTIFGFDPEVFKSNLNRRQQGQFVDMTRYFQHYRVPMRSPITAIHPAHTDSSVDASDVQMLIQHTRTRVANEAVTALLDASETLSEYYDMRDTTNVGPDLLGIGRYYIRPVHFKENINMSLIVDSLTSSDRFADVRAALLNQVRNFVYEAWRQSEYSAASEALNGGMAVKPTVVIATDPYIAQFLQIEGDPRAAGPEFPFEVVSTLDYRMRGKMIMTFNIMDETRNVAPNPLSFGNMLWAPELALTANISRGNTYNKETVVQPRYLFVVNCPIMIDLTIENIPVVLNKLPINMRSVP